MQPLSLVQLIEDAREELDDGAARGLWTKERITKLYNEAIFEGNRRMRCITDDSTPAVCKIDLVAGQAEYPLHPSIIVIRRAVLASNRSTPLCRTTVVAMDTNFCGWRDRASTPRYVVRSLKNKLIVSPTPTAADTLELIVWRDPLEEDLLEGDNDTPEDAGMDAAHHHMLVHWVCFRAFLKHDAEAEMPATARIHLDLFESYFGERPTARELQQLGLDPITGTTAVYF